MIYDQEKIVLVGMEVGKACIPLAESIDELKRLAVTAGYLIIGELSQKRNKPDSKFYIGTGKVEELNILLNSLKPDKVIFDAELSPSQQRNLEDFLGLEIMDRPALIIDIFSQHAKSREGKLQVELAKLEYQLPRLRGMWGHLHRQRGGIGMREVGETQIELDRRIIKKQLAVLKKEIEKIRKNRHLRREKRRRGNLPVIALVGYTNAGKSTLLNALTNSDVLTQDRFFATLDPTTRRLQLESGKTILLTDTVGFIQKLPHQLIVAFRATLEEVSEADLLLHVVDGSHPQCESQIHAVYTVLEELGCATKPMITVFNKIDQSGRNGKACFAPESEQYLKKYAPAVAISALTRIGLEDLTAKLTSHLGA
ncbi:MAG: GTPase HflX [bacterium]